MTSRGELVSRFFGPLIVFTLLVSAVVIGANTPGVERPRFAEAVGAEGELLIGSLSGRFSLPRSSPNGQWLVGRAFSGSNWTAPIYRSSDGVSWEAVPFGNGLSGANDVTIADDGTLYAASHRSSVNARYGQLWRFDGVWTREAEGTSRYQNQNAAEVAASPALRAITQFRPYSGATALLAKGAAPGAFEANVQLPAATSGWALSVVGDRAFVVSATATLVYEQGQPGLATPVGDTPAGNARVYALPSAPASELIAIGGPALTVWRSADFGDSWVKVVFDSPSYRGGVTLGQPQLTDSGEIQFVGLGSDTSGKVLFRERLTVSSGEWSGVERVEVAATATHVVAWPGLSSLAAGGSPFVGLVHGAAAPFEFRSVPVGWEADSSSVVAESSRSGIAFSLNGLVPSRQILSASGTWRVVEDRPQNYKQWLWRSPDGVNWERVTLPPIFSYSDPVAIGDDGAIIVARWVRSSWCCSDARAEFYRFTDGWRGPFATVVAGSWRFGPRTVDVVGDQIVLTTAEGSTGGAARVIRSLDAGQTWASTYSTSVSSPTSSLIDDQRVHLQSTTGSHSTVDFASGTITKVGIPYGTVIGDGDMPGTVRVIGAGTAPATAVTTDGGASWLSDGAFSAAPVGARGGAASISLARDMRVYDVAECTTARMVYSLSRDSTLNAPLAVTSWFLDESKTAALIPNEYTTRGSNSAGANALFAVSPSAGVWNVRSISGGQTSPEQVFGVDGYGVTRRGVSASSGNFTHSETDASVSTVGPELTVVRSYNSMDGRVGMFGRGWTSTFETRVFENCVTKDVTVLHGDGRREYHFSNGQGGYVAAPGYTNRLVKNGTTGWTLNDTDGTVYTFRSDGRLTKVTDADSHALNLVWSSTASNATLQSVTDAVSGRALTFTYANGLVTSVSTTPVTSGGATAPLTWNYVYSGTDLLKVCDPRNNDPASGYCRSYTVENGSITTVTDANGHVDRRVGYQAGRVAWEENGEGDRTTFDYPSETESIVTDPNGHATTTVFDDQRRVVSETDPLGGVTTYTYDARGFRNSTTDPNSNTTSWTFDDDGNVLTQTNGTGATSYSSYDEFNNLIASRDGRSADASDDRYLVTSTWSGVTRRKLAESTPLTSQQPSGTTRTWTYTSGSEPTIGGGVTPAGLPKTEVDPNGAATSYKYDRTGDLREMTDRAGLVTQYTYDELGRRISTTVISDVFPDGVVTLTGFDALGNVVRETGPPVTNEITGHVHRLQTTTVFDPARNRVSITQSDIGGSPEADAPRVTTYEHDDADRIVEITDPEGGVATTTYDAAGNAVSMTDPAGRRVDYTYDDNNRPVSATGIGLVADEGGQPRNVNFGSLAYDPGGRPIQRTDALGHSTTIAYDAADRPVSTTLIGYVNRDGTSRDIELEATTYDAAGNPTEVVAGGGRRNTVHTYDEAGRRVATTLDPTGVNRTTTSIFDPNGNVITSTRSDGTTIEQTRYGYDAADRLLETTTENGDDDLTTTYTYDERGVLTSTVNPRGTTPTADPATYRVDYTTDEFGRVVRTESPPVTVTDNGATTTGQRPAIVTGYDTFGSPTHTLDERAHTTNRRYDRLGREVEIVHPSYTVPSTGTTLTPTETFTYDLVGNLTSRTDRRGRTTNYIFDGLNRRTTQTDPPLGTEPAGVWRWFYDDTGNTVTTVDPRGARTEATYDALNRQRTRTAVVRNTTPTADRFTTTFDYDDLGNPVYEQSPTGDITSSEFSAASEPLTVTDAAGNTTSHAYDVAGRRTATTDPLGRSTQTTYDGAGRAVAADRYSPTGTLVTSTTNGYDPAGNLTSITSPRGNAAGANTQDFTTTFEFDPIGRLSAVTEPVDAATSITTQYGYDAAGNQTVLTDGRGNATRYGYNAWNLQTQVIEPATTAHPNLADRTWTNEFDAGGLPVRSTEPGGVEIERSFDELGRLVNDSGSGPDAPTATRQFGHDAAGLMTSASSPTGTIHFTYDDRRLLTNSTGPAAYTGSYAYDPAGRLVTRTSAAGSTTITWNPRSLPATVTDSLTNTTATHTYNPAGQLSATTYSSGATRTYDYDTLGRLTADTLRAAGGTVTTAHQVGYDLDSNMVERTDTLPGNSAAGTNTYTYDNLGRLASWTQPGTSTLQAFEWDPAGNLTLNAGELQTFDERNRINTAGTTAYTWTPRSTMATQQPGASPAVTFTFDGLGRRTGVDADTYSYDALDRVATRNTDQFSYTGTEIDPTQIGATRFSRGVNGELIATQTSTDPASLIGLNPHGDVSYLFDNSATVASTRTYDPLGATTATSGTQPVVGFQGDYTDPTTNDIWMGARWYQPGTGNFASRDTVFGKLETPISLNRYTYAHGDPLGMWDPDGRRAESRDVCNAFGQEMSNDDLLALAEGGGAGGCAAKRASTVVRDAIQGTVSFAAAGVASLGCAAAAGAVSGANPVAMGGAAGFCGGATQRAVTTLFAGGSLAEAGTAAISPRAAFVDTVGGAIGGGLFQRLGGLNPSLSRSQRAIGGGASFAAEGAARDAISTALNGGSPLQSVFAAGNLQRRFGDVSIGGGLGLAPSPSSSPDFDRRVTTASSPNSVTAGRLAPNSEVPTVVFSRGRSPGIAQNFDDAVANGAPTRLNRVDAATRDANRRAALRGQSPAPAGQSLDEYPFACSAQGGCGSFVRSVPVEEQSYQGGVLSQFFQRNDVRPGDPFDVVFGP